jgi:hypothetical protein
VYLLVRQLAPTPAESRALLAVMIALAVGLSCLALHERFVQKPQQIALFKADPKQALREAGLENYPPGSGEYKRFEDRLNSPEPIATFSLTNSLAAFLAPWLIVTIGVGMFGAALRSDRRRIVLGSVVIAAVIAFALQLTHSRSAWIGTAVGVCALLAWRITRKKRQIAVKRSASGRQWRSAIIGLFLLAAVGAGIAFATLHGLLQPAIKSFQFRLEYWQATLAMIRDHAIWGVGPGNFADTYTLYKLPISSEEIQDPHNFLMEVAANAGVPAAIALLAIVMGFARRVWRGRDAGRPTPSFDTSAATTGLLQWICAGAAAGLGLAILFNKIWGFDTRIVESLIGVAIGAAVVALLLPWIKRGRAPAGVLLAGVSVLLIALLGGGGMTKGGVAGSLWLLIALGLNATEQESPDVRHSFILYPSRPLPMAAAWSLFGLLVVLAVAQFQCGYNPVESCCIAYGQAAAIDRDKNDPKRETKLLLAAAADTWDFRPTRELALDRLRRWQGTRKLWDLKDVENFTDAMLSTDQNAFYLWATAAQTYLQVIAADPSQKRFRGFALDCAGNAVARYPNDAEQRLLLAEALSANGDARNASRQAQEAQRLDDLMPHEDRKLSAEQRAKLSRIISGEGPKK